MEKVGEMGESSTSGETGPLLRSENGDFGDIGRSGTDGSCSKTAVSHGAAQPQITTWSTDSFNTKIIKKPLAEFNSCKSKLSICTI